MNVATAPVEDENYLKKVREQYENYPYPSIDPEIEYVAPRIPVTESFELLNHVCFGGRKDFRKPFRSLVAGGGTGDAAIALAEQLRDTGNEVIYVDMSEASMKVAQKRAENRGLTNIRWIRDSLLNIPKMDLGQFDYINCSGVLHHLADPDLGLKILSDALKEDGAMGIMVYAKYGRMAVYIMQDLLRMLNHDEPNLQKQVDTARKILSNLPTSHWMFHSSQMIKNEVNGSGDVGIYDLLLHTQDRAYSIPELYEFTRKAGLSVLRFYSDYQNISHRIYDPSFYISDPRLLAKIEQMPMEKQHALAELLYSKIEKHTVHLVKKVPQAPSIDDLDMIPCIGFTVHSYPKDIANMISKSGRVVQLKQSVGDISVQFPNAPQLAAIWGQINNQKTLREIFRSVMDSSKDKSVNFQTLSQQFKPCYEALNRIGWMFLRHKTTAPITYPEAMQARIPRRKAV
ncbi:MAG: methyltransferase domain-containing protein [Alphaproteobacteria bacterium]|nr:methyltransferase domain-containing protein [Alphaproteobacteria bacterium]